MLKDLKLQHPDFQGEIWICSSAQNVILGYRQIGLHSTEAGGILVGYRRGPHIEIVETSFPLALDVRRRNSFERKDLGHQAFCDSLWEGSCGTMTYVGEWHTHPEVKPSPSFFDRSEWNKLKKCYEDPLVFLIAGTTHWYLEIGFYTWTFPVPSFSK